MFYPRNIYNEDTKETKEIQTYSFSILGGGGYYTHIISIGGYISIHSIQYESKSTTKLGYTIGISKEMSLIKGLPNMLIGLSIFDNRKTTEEENLTKILLSMHLPITHHINIVGNVGEYLECNNLILSTGITFENYGIIKEIGIAYTKNQKYQENLFSIISTIYPTKKKNVIFALGGSHSSIYNTQFLFKVGFIFSTNYTSITKNEETKDIEEKSAQELYIEAIKSFVEGDMEKARDLLKKVLEKEPDFEAAKIKLKKIERLIKLSKELSSK